eukprot:CAMPEP_0118654010 /NCGR_PEP_ID=MMETSP0785-20121206/12136_1 /TAXON_ID=91992 /ORGANISM="Bolidomonas pacifica, Strain CCMP 1866" /LENGTH=57 /DNA_ID=CAMNT_0006546591 /DNA_START=112 /DNA_END=285 /DNA_ORIENTATION=-
MTFPMMEPNASKTSAIPKALPYISLLVLKGMRAIIIVGTVLSAADSISTPITGSTVV